MPQFPVMTLLSDIAPIPGSNSIEVDTILDDQGHSAPTSCMCIVAPFYCSSTSIVWCRRASRHHLGETPLIRTILSTHSYDAQSLPQLLSYGLSQSIMTLDTSRKSVLHHIVALAGVKGRAVVARITWIKSFYGLPRKTEAILLRLWIYRTSTVTLLSTLRPSGQ